MSNTFTSFQKLKKVNALGKFSASADDKPSFFLRGLKVYSYFTFKQFVRILLSVSWVI